MTAYWWYILKVSACIIVFYTFYTLTLRNCTFFLLNRLYLVLGLLLSFIIPVLNFSIFESPSNSAWSNVMHPFLMEPEYEIFQPQNLPNHVTTIHFSMILPAIYFTGISILFFKLLFSIIRTIRMRHHSETYQMGKKRVIKTDSNLPFSFFNMIFLPKNETNPMIIEHEMAHVRQFHWFDLILIEVVSVLLWFNPFVILYKKSLKLQHEYLADASVIKNRNRVEGYLHCMLQHIQIASFDGFTSHFYCKTIKKRIVMITKNKTSSKYLGVYLFILPLVCFMLFAFSSNKVLAQNSVTVQNDLIQPSIAPIDLTKATRAVGYGYRKNPITKKQDFHYGMDFSIAEGEKVVSTASGVVVDAKFDSKKGNYVIIQHNEIFTTLYSHLKTISVQVGDQLEKGRIIGYSGNTGFATGPHLHYEVFKNGENVNPIDYIPK